MLTIGEYTLQVLASRQLRRPTIHSYIKTVKLLGLWDEPLERVTLQFLYETLLKVASSNTRRKDTIALRSIFRDYPWAKQLKIPRGTPRVYTLPEEAMLRFTLMLCPYELQGLLMMYAGLRCGEACAVGPGDVRGNVLSVFKQMYDDGSIAQAKTVGYVVIPRWLAVRIGTMERVPITPGAVRESFRRYGLKTGIHLNPHMLRHWYATQLVKKRINPEIARRQLRHSDLKTTLGWYTQVSKEDIEEVVDDLFDNGDDNEG